MSRLDGRDRIYPRLCSNQTVTSKKTGKKYKASLWYCGDKREYELAPIEGGDIIKFSETEIASMIKNELIIT